MTLPDNGFRKSNYCPYCFHHVDCAFIPGKPEIVPTSGCLSVCIRCTGVGQWNDDLKLIKFDCSQLNEEEALHIHTLQESIKHVTRLQNDAS